MQQRTKASKMTKAISRLILISFVLKNLCNAIGNGVIIIQNVKIFMMQMNFRQMKLNNELNNMSWRVRPDDVLLEVGRLYGSKVGLQKLNAEVRLLPKTKRFKKNLSNFSL